MSLYMVVAKIQRRSCPELRTLRFIRVSVARSFRASEVGLEL